MGKVIAKIEDPKLKELVDRIYGYRLILDDMALNYGKTCKEFWTKAKELHNLPDPAEKRLRFNIYAYEITEED